MRAAAGLGRKFYNFRNGFKNIRRISMHRLNLLTPKPGSNAINPGDTLDCAVALNPTL